MTPTRICPTPSDHATQAVDEEGDTNEEPSEEGDVHGVERECRLSGAGNENDDVLGMGWESTEVTRCSATARSRMRALYLLFVLFLVFFRVAATPPLSCVVTLAKWIRRWRPIWIPYGDNFQKVHVEECEQEVHASDSWSGNGVSLE